MHIRLGVIMDPITSIKIHKDSTFAMLLAAQRRGWHLSYMEQQDLFLEHEKPFAFMRSLQVCDNYKVWFNLGEISKQPLSCLHILLMRKDPPVDVEYLMTTHILDRAAAMGVLVVNSSQSLRNANEKLFTLQFPDICPPSLVTRRAEAIREFYAQHGDIILKPLNAMGGESVFRVCPNDSNLNVIIETLTNHEHRLIMVQRFISEISAGDKRILVIDGVPIPYALARIPAAGEIRGNLAAGGTGVGIPLTETDKQIVAQVSPILRECGILFAGLDIIGQYLTEINITSPTCIRELDKLFGLDIATELLDACERKLEF